jgi:hypothetical protein
VLQLLRCNGIPKLSSPQLLVALNPLCCGVTCYLLDCIDVYLMTVSPCSFHVLCLMCRFTHDMACEQFYMVSLACRNHLAVKGSRPAPAQCRSTLLAPDAALSSTDLHCMPCREALLCCALPSIALLCLRLLTACVAAGGAQLHCLHCPCISRAAHGHPRLAVPGPEAALQQPPGAQR